MRKGLGKEDGSEGEGAGLVIKHECPLNPSASQPAPATRYRGREEGRHGNRSRDGDSGGVKRVRVTEGRDRHKEHSNGPSLESKRGSAASNCDGSKGEEDAACKTDRPTLPRQSHTDLTTISQQQREKHRPCPAPVLWPHRRVRISAAQITEPSSVSRKRQGARPAPQNPPFPFHPPSHSAILPFCSIADRQGPA